MFSRISTLIPDYIFSISGGGVVAQISFLIQNLVVFCYIGRNMTQWPPVLAYRQLLHYIRIVFALSRANQKFKSLLFHHCVVFFCKLMFVLSDSIKCIIPRQRSVLISVLWLPCCIFPLKVHGISWYIRQIAICRCVCVNVVCTFSNLTINIESWYLLRTDTIPTRKHKQTKPRVLYRDILWNCMLGLNFTGQLNPQLQIVCDEIRFWYMEELRDISRCLREFSGNDGYMCQLIIGISSSLLLENNTTSATNQKSCLRWPGSSGLM